MPKRTRLRASTTEEKAEIQRLAASRKEPIRLVQRARITAAMLEDPELTATGAGLQAGFKSNAMGAMWGKRFNEEGLAGLQDRDRPSSIGPKPGPTTRHGPQPSPAYSARPHETESSGVTPLTCHVPSAILTRPFSASGYRASISSCTTMVR